MTFAGLVQTVPKPVATQNLFGPIEEIAGRSMLVLERNEAGDCLCLEPRGRYLVDVDHEDVAWFKGGGES